MAAAHGHLPEDDTIPAAFRRAVAGLHSARVRSEVGLETMGAPKRLASFAHALTASVTVDDEELADGRLVLLHEPDGHEEWQGSFRVVTLTRAELEPEMASDPLLPEVAWSWLTGALHARGARFAAPSGTVSHTSSHYFGALSQRPASTQIEIRASWTPLEGPDGVPDTAAHLAAWSDLLCTGAGLPPAPAEQGIVPMPARRDRFTR
ncbi:DUF3000 domain-containing protein [Streptomyces thermolineatus]|uniref:DUF3000 domain-containing protein n=1 Tax=Streptomyces thermolineatus TaxID=44033 RepID=A0ABN3LRJ0_9ACTN